VPQMCITCWSIRLRPLEPVDHEDRHMTSRGFQLQPQLSWGHMLYK